MPSLRRADRFDAQLRLQSALRERPGSALGDAMRAAAVERLPASVRVGDLDPRPRGAWTIFAVVVAAAVVAGGILLRARPAPVAVPAPQVQRPVSAVGTASAPPSLVVDVAGAVRRPGLLRLPAGSRVADAIRAAGGVRPGTRQTGVNLARKVVDGEQIVVGGVAAGAAPAAGAPGGSPAAESGPVSLNTATLQQLDSLSGIGPVTSQRIVAWREAHGGFTSVDQLREIEGIGERRLAALRPQVTV